MTMSFIPVNEPLLDGNERKYLNECIETGWISSEGPFVKQFEEKMAQKVNRKFGIAVCNGSVALELALAALELRPGDEVILPTFTIISCAIAIVRRGCTPVLVDSMFDTWNMNVDQVEEKITDKTKAIMVVHTYGLPVDMDPIILLAKKYGLHIIEDAAEMHGQTYKNIPCGSFGDISTLSFYPNKHVTTGEGGMVLTDNDKLAKRCISLRNLCFNPERRFVHEELGYNFRLTNLQAAVGVAQIERLDKFIARKREMGRLYTKLLLDEQSIELPLEQTSYAENIYWVYGLLLKEIVPIDTQEFMNRLKKHQIGSRPFFWPMHEQPVFKKMGLFKDEHFPIAERIARCGFYVPSGLNLSNKQIKKVADAVKLILKEVV